MIPKSKKRGTRSKATRSRRRMILELDADARQRVFERDAHICLRCETPGRAVQWCHVFSRRHLCLRWEEDNAMTLCGGCHMFWHQAPLLAVDWFRIHFPERYDRIMATMQLNPKINVKSRHEELKNADR